MKINNKTELKALLIEANNLYRIGKPIMTDQKFDDLCDFMESQMNSTEWSEFRNSLHENSGKIIHPYIMGSLDKLKYEEPDTVIDFISKYIKNRISVTRKVDGISCRIHYSNGNLTSASTRGDGYKGEDLTDKIFVIKNVPTTIPYTDEIDIRGELVICKNDFEDLNENGEWKNPRNATAGLVNRKEWDKETISHISFIPYAILGTKYTKSEQLKFLQLWGFKVVEAWEFENKLDKDILINKLYEFVHTDCEYECDGLVISDIDYRNEDEYRPDAQKAFKVNESIAETELVDVSWEGPSKNGRMVPVGIVSPVEIAGTMVGRVTLNNVDFMRNLGIKLGSKIKIVKSGEIIPKVLEVMETRDGAAEIELPEICPSCGQPLIREGVDLLCKNKDCDMRKLLSMEQFIKNLDIKNVSRNTLEDWNIKTIDDLLAFQPDASYKNPVKFYNELKTKFFNVSDRKLFCAMNFEGLAEIQLNKIIDFYGWDNIKSMTYSVSTLPDGIGDILIQKFINGLMPAIRNLKKITSDPRYTYVENVQTVDRKIETKGSICVTGSLKFGSRDKFLKMAAEYGYESKGGVSKGLTYLINNDKNSTSSKNKKAKQLGIEILSEDDFMKIIKGCPESSTNLDLL